MTRAITIDTTVADVWPVVGPGSFWRLEHRGRGWPGPARCHAGMQPGEQRHEHSRATVTWSPPRGRPSHQVARYPGSPRTSLGSRGHLRTSATAGWCRSNLWMWTCALLGLSWQPRCATSRAARGSKPMSLRTCSLRTASRCGWSGSAVLASPENVEGGIRGSSCGAWRSRSCRGPRRARANRRGSLTWQGRLVILRDATRSPSNPMQGACHDDTGAV